MISNNSAKWIYGEKRSRGKSFRLTNIIEFERDEIVERNRAPKIRRIEENILYCLKELQAKKSSLEENRIYLLNFYNAVS